MMKIKNNIDRYMIAALVLFWGVVVFSQVLSGCATNQTATQQLQQQTDDLSIIAMGTYYDALSAYKDAQDLYIPYKDWMVKAHPDIDSKITGHFQDAWDVLKVWKASGTVTSGDELSFRMSLRNALIAIAEKIDSK